MTASSISNLAPSTSFFHPTLNSESFPEAEIKVMGVDVGVTVDGENTKGSSSPDNDECEDRTQLQIVRDLISVQSFSLVCPFEVSI